MKEVDYFSLGFKTRQIINNCVQTFNLSGKNDFHKKKLVVREAESNSKN